jgi:hypothetical protein
MFFAVRSTRADQDVRTHDGDHNMRFAIALAASAFLATAAQAVIVINGSFENGVVIPAGTVSLPSPPTDSTSLPSPYPANAGSIGLG